MGPPPKAHIPSSWRKPHTAWPTPFSLPASIIAYNLYNRRYCQRPHAAFTGTMASGHSPTPHAITLRCYGLCFHAPTGRWSHGNSPAAHALPLHPGFPPSLLPLPGLCAPPPPTTETRQSSTLHGACQGPAGLTGSANGLSRTIPQVTDLLRAGDYLLRAGLHLHSPMAAHGLPKDSSAPIYPI